MFSSLFLAVVTYLAAAAVDAGVAKKENSEKSFIEIPKGRLKCIIDWKGRKKEREREREENLECIEIKEQKSQSK